MSIEYEDNAPCYDPNNLSDHQASALLICCFTTYASQALNKIDAIANSIGYLSVAITANSICALPGMRSRQNKGKGKMTVTSTSRNNGMIEGNQFALPILARHPADTAQTLSIMRRMMSKVSVKSFGPKFTQPFDSPDNEHLLDLAVKIFI
ncbi:uncharacterized protein VP01_3903g5, partial [Puccinia sorghi]